LKAKAQTIRAFCMALLVASGVASAQTYREDISITEVEVPVQVLVDNRAVAGLERENFVLLVDGEPQELTWFQAIELDDAGLIATATSTTSSEPAGDAAHAVSRPPTWSRHYLVLFDFAFSSRDRLERGLEGVREMIESQSHPTDRLALAFYAQSLGARILVPFTSDRKGLELGVSFLEATLDAKTGKSVERLEELDAWWREASPAGALPDPMLADLGSAADTLIQPIVRPTPLAGLGLPIGRPTAGESESDYKLSRLNALFGLNYGTGISEVRALSRSLASLVTLLRDIPEPKHLFYLSEGLGGLGTSELERLKPMLNAFRTTGWTLQSIDLTGLLPPPASVLTGPEDFDGDRELRGNGVGVVSAFSDDSLFYLANETGGEAYENYNKIHKATEKVLGRSRVTYLLAFQPSEQLADGDRYDIEVRLEPKIKGARLLHRPGFRAPREPLDRSLTERRMDAAEWALSGEERSELAVTTLPVVIPTAKGARVPLFVEVDTAGLDTGRKGKKKARLDIHGYAVDANGTVRGGFARQLKFRPEDAETVAIATELELPTGGYELRLLAWDLRSGRQRIAGTPLEVGPREDSGPALLGPYFLTSEVSSRRFEPLASQAGEGMDLFELDGELAYPDARPTLRSGRSRRFLVLATEANEELSLAGRVLDSDDTPVASIALEEVAGDPPGRFVGIVDSTGLDPGEYRIEIAPDGDLASPGPAEATFTVLGSG
jgi:VWFA-related protein